MLELIDWEDGRLSSHGNIYNRDIIKKKKKKKMLRSQLRIPWINIIKNLHKSEYW
jgi:hypothetical protein